MTFNHDETTVYGLYKQTGEGRDNLPYTPKFDTMVEDFKKRGEGSGHHDVWVLLTNLLKKGETNIKDFLAEKGD